MVCEADENMDAGRQYWAVSDEDVRREFPGAIRSRTAKAAVVWFTPLFLFELCMAFHKGLNARGLRRHIAAVYSASVLAAQVLHHREGMAPYSFSWVLGAFLGNKALRAVVLKGFSAFVDARVELMRRRQFAYNSQGIWKFRRFDFVSCVKIGTETKSKQRNFQMVSDTMGTVDWPKI